MTSEILTWILADSALPVGGFIFSSGLESALQTRKVKGSEDLENFIESSTESLAATALPFISRVMEIVHNKRFDENVSPLSQLIELDKIYDTLMSNHIVKRSSIAQGIAFLTLITTSFDLPGSLVSDFKDKKREHMTFAHYPIVFGLVTATLEMQWPCVQKLFLFVHVRSIISAAVRLNLIGPYAGTKLLHTSSSRLEEKIGQWTVEEELEDIYQIHPVLDIIQGCHDKLYSKIFNS